MIILDVIRDLQKEIDFDFTIFGLSPTKWDEHIDDLRKKHSEQVNNTPNSKPNDWYSKTIKLADSLKTLKWTHQPFVPLSEYNQTLCKLNLDIGLCPLVDNRFNRCKSAIKFYEYAMVGTCTMASKFPLTRKKSTTFPKTDIPTGIPN